jgi:anti-sigma-K factor RskA
MHNDEQHDSDAEAKMSRFRPLRGAVDFDAGFADRVMARVATPRLLSDELQKRFWRLAPIAIAATLVLSTFNLVTTRTEDQPLVNRVLALPGDSIASAYTLDGDLGEWEQYR